MNKFFKMIVILSFLAGYCTRKEIEFFSIDKMPVGFVLTVLDLMLAPLFVCFIAIVIQNINIDLKSDILLFLGK